MKRNRDKIVIVNPAISWKDKYWFNITSAIIAANKGSVKAITEATVIPIDLDPIKNRT